MASYSVAFAKKATLSTTTADTITITGNNAGHIAIYNDDASIAMSATFSNSGGTATTPTAGADDSFYIPPKSTLALDVGQGVTSVKVVGNGNVYSVMVI